MCVSYGNLSKSLCHFWKLCTQRTQNFIGFFVHCNLFCGLNPTKEAHCIKFRGVWWKKKYLCVIQAKPNGTSKHSPRFAVSPLYLWRSNHPVCSSSWRDGTDGDQPKLLLKKPLFLWHCMEQYIHCRQDVGPWTSSQGEPSIFWGVVKCPRYFVGAP